MPQLDPSQFSSQLVWLALSFVALYLGLSRYILPRLSDLLLERRTRIANDVDEAEGLDKEREKSLARAESQLADARRAGEQRLQRAADAAHERAAKAFEQQADLARQKAQAAAADLTAQERAAHAALAAASGDVAQSLLRGVLAQEAEPLLTSGRLKALAEAAVQDANAEKVRHD